MKEFENNPVEPRIEKFNAEKDLDQIASLYAEVFAGPPWNEYTRCIDCKEFFGLESKQDDPCLNCGSQLTLAYPIAETKGYILDETRRNNASIFVMKKNDELIGFVWGYSYSIDDFAREKYRNLEMQTKIKDLLIKSGIAEEFFYFSECGVKIDQRGNGFSSVLSELLIKEGQKTKLPIVMRTNWESPMVAVAQRFQMRQIMGPMVEIDKARRTILPKKGAVNNFTDMEIEERVLFVLK